MLSLVKTTAVITRFHTLRCKVKITHSLGIFLLLLFFFNVTNLIFILYFSTLSSLESLPNPYNKKEKEKPKKPYLLLPHFLFFLLSFFSPSVLFSNLFLPPPPMKDTESALKGPFQHGVNLSKRSGRH